MRATEVDSQVRRGPEDAGEPRAFGHARVEHQTEGRQALWIIHAAPAFALLGLDSILSAQFVEGVNRIWGLREPTALLYDHPDLASVAAYVAANSRASGGGSAPGAAVPTGASKPTVSPTVAVSAASGASGASGAEDAAGAQVDLEALLDAVRDDLLSVDEAAALLGTRPA